MTTAVVMAGTWEFDSHLEIIPTSGRKRLVQVWSRPSVTSPYTREWVVTEDTPGKENPPSMLGRIVSTSTYAFRKLYPNFNRYDQHELERMRNDKKI
jgi:hypothetical protein